MSLQLGVHGNIYQVVYMDYWGGGRKVGGKEVGWEAGSGFQTGKGGGK